MRVGYAKFKVSLELIAQGLHLPDDVLLVRIHPGEPWDGTAWLIVEGGQFPDEGQPIEVEPVVSYTKERYDWKWTE